MANPYAMFAMECELPDTLNCLARIGDEEIQNVVVRNPSTSSRTLMYLTDSPYTSVRSQIAFHDNVNDDIIEKLAKDLAPEVLTSLAMVATTPKRVLESLAHVTNSVVRYALTKNPSTPASALEIIADSESSSLILLHIAKHKNTNQETLEKLSKAQYRSVRTTAVARTLSTKIYISQEMTHDSSKDIINIATSRTQH